MEKISKCSFFYNCLSRNHNTNLIRQWVYVHSSIAIILMGKRELVALLNLSSWSCDGSAALPCGAMGLSAVCDCVIS